MSSNQNELLKSVFWLYAFGPKPHYLAAVVFDSKLIKQVVLYTKRDCYEINIFYYSKYVFQTEKQADLFSWVNYKAYCICLK